MTTTGGNTPSIQRVLAATDRSKTADRAVRWAASMAASHGAELLLFQVLFADTADDIENGTSENTLGLAHEKLMRFAEELAGPRGRARAVVANDPTQAILDAIEEEQVDVVVVGNVGMSGRKQFLLGNIPNRISHNARCSVVIVNTAHPDGKEDGTERLRGAAYASADVEGRLLGRAWRIGRIMAKAG
ncbi:MAG: universal stress protein, partial [Rubrobacter sp.]|nr:universal stress protein [Rubrobacter sp.]